MKRINGKKGADVDLTEAVITWLFLIILLVAVISIYGDRAPVKRTIDEDSLALDTSRLALTILKLPADQFLIHAPLEQNIEDALEREKFIDTMIAQKDVGHMISRHGGDKETRCTIARLLNNMPLTEGYAVAILAPGAKVPLYNLENDDPGFFDDPDAFDVVHIAVDNEQFVPLIVATRPLANRYVGFRQC